MELLQGLYNLNRVKYEIKGFFNRDIQLWTEDNSYSKNGVIPLFTSGGGDISL